jgi:hypothetical protein
MRKSGLPKRFPKGSKYVLEADGDYVRRYVECPDGRKVRLPKRKQIACHANLQDISIIPASDAQDKSIGDVALPHLLKTSFTNSH